MSMVGNAINAAKNAAQWNQGSLRNTAGVEAVLQLLVTGVAAKAFGASKKAAFAAAGLNGVATAAAMYLAPNKFAGTVDLKTSAARELARAAATAVIVRVVTGKTFGLKSIAKMTAVSAGVSVAVNRTATARNVNNNGVIANAANEVSSSVLPNSLYTLAMAADKAAHVTAAFDTAWATAIVAQGADAAELADINDHAAVGDFATNFVNGLRTELSNVRTAANITAGLEAANQMTVRDVTTNNLQRHEHVVATGADITDAIEAGVRAALATKVIADGDIAIAALADGEAQDGINDGFTVNLNGQQAAGFQVEIRA